MIRIGPAGWSYTDWKGIVYPERGRIDQLQYLSQFFRTIEINNTFYRPPAAKTSASWARRTEHNRDFRFTLKLSRHFTHEREAIDGSDVREWTDGVEPLCQAGKIGAILLQFPWSFKNDDQSRQYLVRLVEAFQSLPLVVEVRHASWDQDSVLELLSHLRVGICNVDQPVIGKSLRPHSHVTSKVSYFRFHGRNYRDWFREGAGRDARYNYLYREEEVDQQVDLVEATRDQAEDVYVIYNNHYRGQAVVNALQLRRRLEGSLTDIPEALANRYPVLSQRE